MPKSQLYRYYLFVFLKDITFFSAVLVPFFTDWGGLSQLHIQLLQSWFMIWFFILEIPTGAVADYLGRKYSLIAGGFVLGLAALLYGSLPSFYVFLAAEFLFALAMALMSGADNAWLYDSLKEFGQEDKSAQYLGWSESVHLFALLVSAPIGSFFAEWWGLQAPMLATALPCFLAAVVGLGFREPKFHQAVSESRRYLDIMVGGCKYLLHHKTLWWLSVDMACVGVAAYFMMWLYQPLLSKLGLPIFWFGTIHAGLVLVEIAISSNFVMLEKITKKISYRAASAVLVAIGFFTVVFDQSYTGVLFFVVLVGGFGMTRITYMNILMQSHIESDQRATVLSAVSMVRKFGLIVFNPIIGFLADKSLSAALVVLGFLALGSLVVQNFKNKTA